VVNIRTSSAVAGARKAEVVGEIDEQMREFFRASGFRCPTIRSRRGARGPQEEDSEPQQRGIGSASC